MRAAAGRVTGVTGSCLSAYSACARAIRWISKDASHPSPLAWASVPIGPIIVRGIDAQPTETAAFVGSVRPHAGRFSRVSTKLFCDQQVVADAGRLLRRCLRARNRLARRTSVVDLRLASRSHHATRFVSALSATWVSLYALLCTSTARNPSIARSNRAASSPR
jgi:hypothetical protein